MPFNRCMHYPFAITWHDLSFTVWFQALNFLRRRELDILVDPALRGQCSQPCLEHAFFVVSRCISESPNMRPSMRDVVASLTVMSEVRNRRRLDRGGRSTPTRTSSDRNPGRSTPTRTSSVQNPERSTPTRTSSDRDHQGDDQGERNWGIKCIAKQWCSSVAAFCGDGQLLPVWEQESCNACSNGMVELRGSTWSWWRFFFPL
jgi:hypothetical protein